MICKKFDVLLIRFKVLPTLKEMERDLWNEISEIVKDINWNHRFGRHMEELHIHRRAMISL